MGFIKKIVALVAIAALIYFAPGIGAGIASQLGITSAFVGSLIGTVIIAAGSYLVMSVLGLGGARAPDMEAGKVNVKIADPPRWLNAGRARQGGGALFGEFDSQGRWWYLIVHSDEILHAPDQYYLDDVPVTLDGSNYVIQKEFRLKTNKDKDPAEADGEGKGYVRIFTTTYSETDPTPPRIAALDAALGSLWTADHRLVGTTFSVVCMDALDVEHRYKIYRWRGPFGLGEPAVSIVGDWANVYDPRDETQVLGDRTTYKPSRNAALIWAWFRTHPFGRNKPESSINWDRVAEQADICDQEVEGIESTQPRYEAGVAIVDSKRRADAEKEILLACDGQIVFDEDGKSWVRVGHWEAPTLSFSRNRDIMAMSSVEAQDGESETQGVIVRYIDPAANYTVQPSAAWINPLYYDPLTTPKFLIVDIQPIQNHNQAMRVAKGIGMRSQPRHKIGPTVNLRGLQARHERIVTINYDNTFAGDYEIATPVELDGAGIFTGFGAVPIDPSRWTLLPGEEQPKPVVDGTVETVTFPAITGESVYLSEGVIRIDFPALPRDDANYVAEYILTSEITGGESDPWTSMSINITTALSGLLIEGVSYTVRYRYVVTSGRGPAWEYATLSTTAPFNFNGTTMPPEATLSRSSTARYYNSSGQLTTAAIDAARFDRTSTTGTLRGLLIEPSATNLVPSGTDTTAWANISGVTKTDGQADPAGGTAAALITATGASFHLVGSQNTAVTNAQVYTGSFFVKPGTGTRVQAYFRASGFDATHYANFLLTGAGSVTAANGCTAAIEQLANGWYRVSITHTANATVTDTRITTIFIDSGTAGRNPAYSSSETLTLYGHQIETGARASSHIPTPSAATVSRSADAVTLNWSSRGVADGSYTVRYTFDDNTTQDVATTITAGASIVPTNLNRPWINKAAKL